MFSKSRSPSASSLLLSFPPDCMQERRKPSRVPSFCMDLSSVSHEDGSYCAATIVRTTDEAW